MIIILYICMWRNLFVMVFLQARTKGVDLCDQVCRRFQAWAMENPRRGGPFGCPCGLELFAPSNGKIINRLSHDSVKSWNHVSLQRVHLLPLLCRHLRKPTYIQKPLVFWGRPTAFRWCTQGYCTYFGLCRDPGLCCSMSQRIHQRPVTTMPEPRVSWMATIFPKISL